jgi:hypothetical protein
MLVDFDSLNVPNLEQELLIVVILFNTIKSFDNDWHVLHILVVSAGFVNSVQTVQLDVV